MRIILILCLIYLVFASTAHAASSSYVLPYPSVMPGGINYQLHLVWEKLMQYWYFGEFGQFEYNLKESDKYLVEAKTLFEYNQYLLGYKALQKSNSYFMKALPNLSKAQRDGKDITQKLVVFRSASQKHIEVLLKMKEETPGTFTWTPEKNPSALLQIHTLIDASIAIRQKNV